MYSGMRKLLYMPNVLTNIECTLIQYCPPTLHCHKWFKFWWLAKGYHQASDKKFNPCLPEGPNYPVPDIFSPCPFAWKAKPWSWGPLFSWGDI